MVASHEAKCLAAGLMANIIMLPFYITCLQILHLLHEIKKLSESLMGLCNNKIINSLKLANRGYS